MFEQEVIEIDAFDKIARVKTNVIEFGEVKDVGFKQDGGRNVELAADICKVIEKVGLGQLFRVVFVNELFGDLSVLDDFSPDPEHNKLRMFF